MACPDTNEIAALVEGRLDDMAIARLQDHLDSCAACFSLVAELARGDNVAATAGDGPAPSWGESRRLDEYKLVRPIGRGSGGQVWLAHDTNLDREVAIKFVTATTNPIAHDRFRIEARAVARLDHPNVVRVHRVGVADGQPYLVSELVRGESLDVAARPMPWTRVREIGIGLARGLAAAHGAGIIHRDIKPGNAIVSDAGEIKLLDFGLAKLHDAGLDDTDPDRLRETTPVSTTPDLTATGHLLGTPLYMPPEAWRGERPTFAWDVYSLGALLYELCTGGPPHPGSTVGEIRRATLHDPVEHLTNLIPGIDPAFARVVETCLVTTPDARYPSAVELAAALEATIAVPPAARPRPRRWWPLVAIGGALAIGGAITAVALRHPSAAASIDAAVARGPATPAAPQRCSSDRWCWDESSVGSWTGSLGSIWGATADDLWLTGERGVVRHFQHGTWTDVSVSTVADLGQIYGTARDDVWIVGGWGTILHWDGTTWREDVSGTHVALRGVWAAARDDAWVIGVAGTMLHWDGTRWRSVPTPTTNDFFAISGSGPNDVWATGFQVCIHWDGKSWTLSNQHSPEVMLGLRVVGPRDVWSWGFHSAIRHWDGKDWSVVPVPGVAGDAKLREDFPFNGGYGIGADELWLIAKRRGFLHRVGQTWTRVEQPTQHELFSLFGAARDDVWAVGAAGALAHWDGTSWKLVNPEVPYRGSLGLWARAPDDVWAVGVQFDRATPPKHHALAMRFDGRAWHEVASGSDETLRAVSGYGDEVWAVGERGMTVVWRDGVAQVVPSGTDHLLRGVWADAPGRAWAVGDDVILRFTDGAWHPIKAPAGSWSGIWGVRPGDAWIVGEHGILRLQGDAWTEVASGTTQPLAAVWGASADDVWAVGDNGATVHWDGKAWKTFFSDFDQPLASISGSASDDVWAVSNSDQGGPSLIHWNGSFWTRIERTTHASLPAVVAVGPGEAWAAGSWSTFLHHVPGA